MINVAICDNDQKMINTIKQYVIDYQETKQCKFKIYQFTSGEDLCKSYIVYDLIFLDIEMDGMDGINTVKLLRQKYKKTRIVYVTVHSECAITAYTVHPFDFILKPVTADIIFNVLTEFMAYFTNSFSENNIIEFKGINGPLLLDITNIYAFEYTGNRRVTVFTQDEKYVIRAGIKEVLNQIDSKLFLSPHKSFIINVQYVKSLNNCIICMKNDMKIPIAQKKLKEFQTSFRNLTNQKVN